MNLANLAVKTAEKIPKNSEIIATSFMGNPFDDKIFVVD